MKTRMSFRPVLLAAVLLIYSNSEAQVSIEQNFPSIPNSQYVGWDNTTTEALMIRQDEGNWPIEFYTTGDNISEMWLTPTLTNFFFNATYPSLDLSGNLGVGPGFSAAIPPLSRLHLNSTPMLNVSSYTPGFRDWMRTGTLCTEGRDGMYIGLKHEGTVFNHSAILNWSSNIAAGGVVGRDPLRFIYTCHPNSPGAQATDEGLEIARMWPDAFGNEGYFGLGDFNVAGVQPSERLDVLNGHVAIRDLPTDPVSSSLNFVTVNMTTGVLEHRPLPTTPIDCEWTMNVGSPNHVFTAHTGTDPACPDQSEGVGIGVDLTSVDPEGKLHIENRSYESTLFSPVTSTSFLAHCGARVETSSNLCRVS